MPETSTYGLNIAGQGGDCGPHLRCTPGAAGYTGDHIEGAELHICEAVIGLGELDEHAVKRLALLRALGGCGLRMDTVGLAADAAFWSTWAMTTKVAPGIARVAGLGKVPAADEQAAAAA